MNKEEHERNLAEAIDRIRKQEYDKAIASLQRYHIEAASGSGGDVWTDTTKTFDGEYVKFEDVEKLLKEIFKQN